MCFFKSSSNFDFNYRVDFICCLTILLRLHWKFAGIKKMSFLRGQWSLHWQLSVRPFIFWQQSSCFVTLEKPQRRFISCLILISGWTLSAAGLYCSDYIERSQASKKCLSYVGNDRYTDSCQSDLLFSGNSRVASLHLKNLKEDCRQVIETDKSLSLTQVEKEEIFETLCLSGCSGHGTCNQGKPS